MAAQLTERGISKPKHRKENSESNGLIDLRRQRSVLKEARAARIYGADY